MRSAPGLARPVLSRIPARAGMKASLCVLACVLVWAFEALSQSSGLPDFVPGTEVTRTIEAGDKHIYGVRFDEAEQCARAVLDQRGTDLLVEFRTPEGKLLARFDSRWHGAETISLISPAAGTHVVEVRRLLERGAPGVYTLRIGKLRRVEASDRTSLKAQDLATGLKDLVTKGTAASLKAALVLADEVLQAWRDAADPTGEAQALNTLGFVRNALGDGAEALKEYEKALEKWRAIGERSGQGEALHNMAQALFVLGDRETALAHYQQALDHRIASGDRVGEGVTLANLGTLYQAIGKSDEALDVFSRGLQVQRQNGDIAGETQCLMGLGVVYAQQGELQKGLDHLSEALPLMEKGGNLRALAYTKVNIGKLYADMGNAETGLHHLNEAGSLMQKAGDKRGEAAVYQRISGLLLERDQARPALEIGSRALSLSEEAGDQLSAAMALISMARAHGALGEMSVAKNLAERALATFESLSDSRGVASALHILGVLSYRQGEMEEAIEYLSRAVDGWQQGAPSRANSLLWRASAEYALSRLEDARIHGQQALEIIEASRIGIAGDNLRTSYVAASHQYYEFYIQVLMRLHNREPQDGWDAEAFRFSERARARSLLEALAETRTEIREGADPELLARESRLRREINALAEQTSAPGRGRPGAEARLAVLLSELVAMEAEIRRRSPRYASLTQPQTLDLGEIQRKVLDNETTLLGYSLGADRSYLWVLNAGSLNSFEIPKRDDLEATILELRNLLLNVEQAGPDKEWRQRWKAVAGRLSEALLPPQARKLFRKRLLIVAEGALHYVPFAALPYPENETVGVAGPEMLGMSRDIVRAPSASLLQSIRSNRSRRVNPSKMVAIFADPVFEATDPRLTTARGRNIAHGASPASVQTEGLQRLAFTRREALEIARLVPEDLLLSLSGFEANRAHATHSRLREYRVVHFATHALIRDARPELSGIVLSLFDRSGSPQNGHLRLHEIYNLDLPADLIVLSACQSALGPLMKGEGMIGLTRGFMYAGASSVLASLWKVNDEATADLMAEFYKAMFRDEMRPAAALRAAKARMVRQRRWSHPYYWAGFVLHGDWR